MCISLRVRDAHACTYTRACLRTRIHVCVHARIRARKKIIFATYKNVCCCKAAHTYMYISRVGQSRLCMVSDDETKRGVAYGSSPRPHCYRNGDALSPPGDPGVFNGGRGEGMNPSPATPPDLIGRRRAHVLARCASRAPSGPKDPGTGAGGPGAAAGSRRICGCAEKIAHGVNFAQAWTFVELSGS